MTDQIGVVSCIAKGAKRTKSSLLASSQYLVYSEFVLFKGTSFYHINQAEIINTFYNLKLDLDKLNTVYSMTKSLIYLTNENMDTSSILKLFLNCLYFIENGLKNEIQILNIFRIKLVNILGFSPQMNKCSVCNNEIMEKNKIFYDYISNLFICDSCNNKKTSRQIIVSYPCYKFIDYICKLSLNKIFSLDLNEKYLDNLNEFGVSLLEYVQNCA